MNALIETALGLAVLYFLASLLVSAVVEYIAAVFRMRARVLRDALETILGNAALVLDHPLVRATEPFRSRETRLDRVSRWPARGVPGLSYVHPRLMAQALVSPVVSVEVDSGAGQLLAAVRNLPAVRAAANPRDASQVELERWFDEAMKRWAGVYTRQSRAVSLLVCVVLVPALNLDSVAVARQLWRRPEVRLSVVEQATRILEARGAAAEGGAARSAGAVDPVSVAWQALDELGLPLGWSRRPDGSQVLGALVGWFISVVAISAGSGFWFGALNRITNLRLTGPPPREGGRSGG